MTDLGIRIPDNYNLKNAYSNDNNMRKKNTMALKKTISNLEGTSGFSLREIGTQIQSKRELFFSEHIQERT